MSSYFITGGNGFIGAAVARKLVQEGHNIRVMLRDGASVDRLSGILSKVEVVRGDLGHLDAAQNSLRERNADALIHTAWAGVARAERNDLLQVTVNIPASIRLCEIAAQTGCRAFIGLGSQAEYGSFDGVLDEQTPVRPNTAYGFAKQMAGELCRNLCSMAGMRSVWLRVLSVYGPGDNETHMVPTVIRSLLRGDKPKLTHGLQEWDYLYIDDCAAAISAILKTQAEGIFVLGSGEATRIREVVELVRDKIDEHLPLGFGEIDRSTTVNLRADVSKLMRLTGWHPSTPLNLGLDLTIASIAASIHPVRSTGTDQSGLDHLTNRPKHE